MVERIPGWIERILMPRLGSIEGEIKALSIKVEELDKRFSLRLDEGERRLSIKIDDLDKRLDMAQRLAVVEAKMKEFEVGH